MQQHTHNYTRYGATWNGETSNEAASSWKQSASVATSTAGGTQNSSENRPRNIALAAIIKY